MTTSCLAGSPDFFFYHPDSPQNNLGRLKQEVELFFTANGFPIHFQPVAQISDLDAQLRKSQPAFTLVPRWYLDEKGTDLQMVPLLTAQCNGKNAYTKLLLTRKNSQANHAPTNSHRLALTTMGPGGDTRIKSLLFLHGAFADTNPDLIQVPKDTDALLALALGQVDLALVSVYTLEKVRQQNPQLADTVSPLAGSLPVPMPVLCYTENIASNAEVKNMKRLLTGTDTFRQNRQLHMMLQIDEWKIPTTTN